MKNTKKNLGGLGFLLPPAKPIETVKEVQENESSAAKLKESSNGDSQKQDSKGSKEKESEVKEISSSQRTT